MATESKRASVASREPLHAPKADSTPMEISTANQSAPGAAAAKLRAPQTDSDSDDDEPLMTRFAIKPSVRKSGGNSDKAPTLPGFAMVRLLSG